MTKATKLFHCSGPALLLLLLLLFCADMQSTIAFLLPPPQAARPSASQLRGRPLPRSAAAAAAAALVTPLCTPRCPLPLTTTQLHALPATAAAGAATAISFPSTLSLTSLHASPWWVWSMLLLASTTGVAAERSKIGAALSSPLITMAVALVACNMGLLPAAAPAYTTVNKFLVPLAIPLLLLDANLFKVLTQTGRLLRSFFLGSIGTILGTIAASWLVPLRNMGLDGKEGWTIAAALASRHIGGAVNFVAVTETLGTSAELTAAGIAADNLVVSFYFGLLFWLARDIVPEQDREEGGGGARRPQSQGEPWARSPAGAGGDEEDAPALGYLKALSLSSVLCLAGTMISDGLLQGAISSLPVISLLSITVATCFPKFCARMTDPAGHLAIILMNLFFSVTGAQGKLGKVLATAPRLFLFSAVQLLLHLGFLLGVGRGICRLPLKELLVASNANVGGPTTAAAMAGSKRWKSLVLPGILTGIFGYATATFLGLVLGRTVLFKMMLPVPPS